MSTKSHFINENEVEGFHETSLPRSVFGKFRGFDVYFIVEAHAIDYFKVKDEYFYFKIKNSEYSF